MLLVKIQWHSNIVGNKKADMWDYQDFGLTITEFWTCLAPSLRLAVSEEFVQPEILNPCRRKDEMTLYGRLLQTLDEAATKRFSSTRYPNTICL